MCRSFIACLLSDDMATERRRARKRGEGRKEREERHRRKDQMTKAAKEDGLTWALKVTRQVNLSRH